jgi:Protein of unknown function, DUF488
MALYTSEYIVADFGARRKCGGPDPPRDSVRRETGGVSAELVKQALAARSDRDWQRFVNKYRREMAATDASAALEMLAALSHQADFAVGCYCADERRCHRSVLRELLQERGAQLEPTPAGGAPRCPRSMALVR